ncbi:MAG TPA: sugar phosphate nucleotidyltransferase, partial [Cyclobacteriaceae bacterium]|nr:sugar phosphate nucleotidyltransferase [Cyclobacteriaceae bacterium]
GRIKKAADLVTRGPFMLTYGDGVSDVNLKKLESFHRKRKKIVTMTSVQPEGRFGAIKINKNNKVDSFTEKPKGDGSWVNGGFFVCEPGVFDYIDGDNSIFENEPLEKLASDGQLYTYRHTGFWQCMDSLRDKRVLNEMWDSGKPQWKIWS